MYQYKLMIHTQQYLTLHVSCNSTEVTCFMLLPIMRQVTCPQRFAMHNNMKHSNNELSHQIHLDGFYGAPNFYLSVFTTVGTRFYYSQNDFKLFTPASTVTDVFTNVGTRFYYPQTNFKTLTRECCYCCFYDYRDALLLFAKRT